MKNKKQIWILGPLVLLVWGMIGYRVFNALKGNSETYPVYQAPPSVQGSDSTQSNAYSLIKNYPDPFLKKERRSVSGISTKTNSSRAKVKTRVTKTVVPIPLRWPVVNYKGSIERRSTSSILYVLEIEGINYFLSKGDEENDLKLLEVYEDSVKVEFKGKEKRVFHKL